MHHASPDSSDMTGYFLPEGAYARLRDVDDELQLQVALTATTHALDGEILPMEFKRAGLASYLRGVHERIEKALQECRYPAKLGEAEEGDEEVDNTKTPRVSGPLVFGVTVDQVDEAYRLIRRICTHGDMLASNYDEEFAEGSLINIGHIIFEEARAALAIVRQINEQRLKDFATPHAPTVPKAGPAAAASHETLGSLP